MHNLSMHKSEKHKNEGEREGSREEREGALSHAAYAQQEEVSASFDCCQWQACRITRTERQLDRTARLLMDRRSKRAGGRGEQRRAGRADKPKMKSNARDLLQLAAWAAARGGATMHNLK